ncbi:hypothetical protein RUM43_002217 [Polyplax serrata]|uniref:Disks large homolog 5 n=1 Tax=Polyplax serrata TaxID=468196 RepID=A0AAN8P201_POLSC
MASGASSLESAGSGPPSLSYTNSERGLSSNARDHESLKQQYEKALLEVQLLRRQNSDMSRQCDHTSKELDYYRNQHRAAMNQLEASAQESSALRVKYGELAAEKQRLEREIQNLHQDVSVLQSQEQQEIINNDTNTTDSVNQHYVTISRKFESLKDEYDTLRKRHDDVLTSHTAAVNKIELTQEELGRTKNQYDEVVQERNDAIRERNGLKQQCTAVIMQWDIALRERNEYRDALSKVQQQHDDAVKEINQAMLFKMKTNKDIKRLTEERNAAMQEYSLIMSERDSVHKEMEKLSDDLSQEIKKNKNLQTQNKDLSEEKKILSYQMETLKREIQSALHDRDKALKECNDLREKFGEYTAKEESNTGFKSRLEFSSYNRERDNSRKDQAEVSSSTRDLYGISQKERMDNLDQANQELDTLRKQLDKLQAELQEATQEAEVSKRRRDWAFNERDKIVLERESIRTLCDRLRKERDRAVSDLAEALRDSDDIKKQRNEASKELKELKEKIEAQLEKENRVQQFHAVGHNHSHDSAIDTDMQEWETEILDIDLTGLASDGDLGFDLVGGRDDPQFPNDSSIYVSSVTKGSVIDGKLKVNDCISRVNNLDCTNVNKRMVMETVRSNGNTASMVVRRRRRVGARCLQTTQLQPHLNYEHGLSLGTGIYISKINSGSLAAKEGNLAVGDRILSINNKTMDGMKSAREAMSILDEARDTITITTLKNGGGGQQNGSTEDDRGFGSSRNSSSPSKDHSENHFKKVVDSTSQTEDMCFESTSTDDFISNRLTYMNSSEQGSKQKSNTRSKTTANSVTWNTIREKFHNVTTPKNLKRNDKKHTRNVSPAGDGFEREQDDAIAELDSVIDTYHTKQNKRKEKGLEQNGGTWPKVRGGPIIQQGTGTIVHPRKTKVRLPLSDILSNNSINKYQTDFPRRTGTQRPVSDFVVPFSKSGQLIHSFPTSPFKDASMEFERDTDRDNLSVHDPSDGSIDLSVKSGNTGKDVMDYYACRKNRYAVSDSESNISPVDTSLPPHTRGHSQLYPSTGLRSLSHYPYPHHLHLHATRYQSPTHVSFTHSGDSIGIFSGFDPPRTPPQQFHTHSPSIDYTKSLSLPPGHTHPTYRVDDIKPPVVSSPLHGHEVGTFPRKKENPRIRIPSNPSVTNAGKMSTGSIERTSERGSPMPPYYTFEVLRPGRENKRNSLPDYYCNHSEAAPGEKRRVQIDKSVEPLGIQIASPKCGGIFVSSVTENSIASKAGLLIGHQILDVCGINLRKATFNLAASVLQQCGNSITMLVEYNPDKYHESEASPSTSDDESHLKSDSTTPRNSPKSSRKSTGEPANLRGTFAQSTLTRNQISPVISTLTRQNATIRCSNDGTKSVHGPRYVCIETKKCSNLGISLVGGNAVGIFVHSVQVDSSAYNAGLRTGDQILECRGTDLRQATAEEAAYELAKPADKVTILALFNIDRYNEIKDKPGDSFYIKALFDRLENCNDSLQLRFHKDDVLYVDNTMFDRVPGHWSAWLVDEYGSKKQHGIIPSKYKVEEDMLRKSMGDLESDSRRGTTTARRSFFRRKKHQRSSSRDSKELASFISTMNWYSDSGTLNEETPLFSYQRVERLDYPTYRPVIIIGPLSDWVTEKLLQDFPDKFTRYVPQVMQCSQSTIEKAMAEKMFIDYRKKGNYYECTTVATFKDICDKNSHCILDVNLQSVERLHKHQIYPIVLLMKFKSTKHIKEVKDARYATDKVSTKAAKEMYEHAMKVESECRHYISVVIQVTGVNIAYMCTQIKSAVDHEQSKTLWVPCSNM